MRVHPQKKEEYVVFLLLYVYDILIANQYKDELEELKQILSSEFKMKDLGPMRHILKMNIQKDQMIGILRLSQQGYLQNEVERFKMH